MPRKVSWITCTDEQGKSNWCSLSEVNLPGVKEAGVVGVYTIWHEGKPGRYIRVGQGIIADRLILHRTDETIRVYRGYGTLRVTWAVVPEPFDRDGIERFLADKCNPLVGERHPRVAPIEVNLPGRP